MSLVKSLSVGNGDMYYINHNSDNFTVIDCCLSDDNKQRITSEIKTLSSEKGITRFISTHPDEDHIQGLEYFDEHVGVTNFYCVQNQATKDDETDSFKHYCALRDGSKASYIYQDRQRRWMNTASEERGSSGINILWPNASNRDFQTALELARLGIAFNNISAVIRYSLENGARMLWLGDLETDFMEAIEDHITLRKTHIVFAPHHGRKSGKIPNSWLDKLQPEIIMIGEAPSRHLHYYSGYHTITQNKAWDTTFDLCDANKVHIYVDNPDYPPPGFLTNEGKSKYKYYIGTLNI
jgi:beta-lactamase superfamily II metal-dependent hydrolase